MSGIIKKITLRDLYRNAGKIARDVERGVSFEVSVRNKKSFIIKPMKNTAFDGSANSKEELLKQAAGFIDTEPKHKSKTDDELIYD